MYVFLKYLRVCVEWIGSICIDIANTEEFVSARTFLRHKEAYYDDHTRIWSKDSQSALFTSEDDGDDGGAIQINSGQGYIMHVVSLVVLAISALSLISLYYFCI